MTLRRLALLAPFLLAACARGDLPEAPPPADAIPSPGLFTLSPGTPADGTVRLTLARGSATARGTLQTNAQSFPFTITGLSVQDGAPARATVTGRVFGLERSGDFAGTYRDVGGVASDLGAALRLGNDNLVLIELRSAPPGLALGVPPQGATVTLGR
ncbi:hypothetical protein GXW78_09505 [Roseomonas terrae]|uniref:CHRD domain-containing protein n=1 Tax=Neoroseomonas terrae TaxID=424799 RepID=A0ABS5EFV2_9PROT|nr:hypothetical protein [Neoroseomonas terrae]MBR0649899.1 hypothetical protein [Neoroseomonas terrae]